MVFVMRSWGVAPCKIMLVIPWCAYYLLVIVSIASHFLPGHLENGSHPQFMFYPSIVDIVQQHTPRLSATRMPHRRPAQKLGRGTTSVSNTNINVYGRVYVDKWTKKYFDLIQGSLPSS